MKIIVIVYFRINGTSYNLPFTLHNLIDPELDQSRYTYSIPPGMLLLFQY